MPFLEKRESKATFPVSCYSHVNPSYQSFELYMLCCNFPAQLDSNTINKIKIISASIIESGNAYLIAEDIFNLKKIPFNWSNTLYQNEFELFWGEQLKHSKLQREIIINGKKIPTHLCPINSGADHKNLDTLAGYACYLKVVNYLEYSEKLRPFVSLGEAEFQNLDIQAKILAVLSGAPSHSDLSEEEGRALIFYKRHCQLSVVDDSRVSVEERKRRGSFLRYFISFEQKRIKKRLEHTFEQGAYFGNFYCIQKICMNRAATHYSLRMVRATVMLFSSMVRATEFPEFLSKHILLEMKVSAAMIERSLEGIQKNMTVQCVLLVKILLIVGRYCQNQFDNMSRGERATVFSGYQCHGLFFSFVDIEVIESRLLRHSRTSIKATCEAAAKKCYHLAFFVAKFAKKSESVFTDLTFNALFYRDRQKPSVFDTEFTLLNLKHQIENFAGLYSSITENLEEMGEYQDLEEELTLSEIITQVEALISFLRGEIPSLYDENGVTYGSGVEAEIVEPSTSIRHATR